MYKDGETIISYKYLKDIIKHLDEPICLLGGWAVYFIVNDNFKEEKGYPYLGSRDIDLGLKDAKAAMRVIKKLEKLQFQRVSFRFYKEIHSETKKELNEEEAKKIPLHYIFPMYVDIMMPEINRSIKSKLGFMPITEPLLKFISDKKYHKKIIGFGKEIIIPDPALLLAMKISAVGGRSKGHKKIKDICDLIAICLYSGIDLDNLKRRLKFILDEGTIKKNLTAIDKNDVKDASNILEIESGIIFDLTRKLKT